MNDRKRKFDIAFLARAQFRSTDGPQAQTVLDEAMPPGSAELLRLFKIAPRKPLLVSEMATLLGRAMETCVDPVIALVKAGCLDLLQRADGGNHLVALTAVGRAQVEVM